MTEKIFNWGIIGLGKIARKFADDLKLLPNARLHAVASSSAERSADFARHYGASFSYGSYEELVQCPDLDIVYVATPHVTHAANTIHCLEHKLPVLCEKPFAMNSREVQRMVDAARQNDVFLMEALWSRFNPAIQHALQLVADGEIGEVHTVKADFGFRMPHDPESRVLKKSLGGGALLDIGIYPAALALFVFGPPEPQHIQAVASFGATDVDMNTIFTFQYPPDKLALGHSTLAATLKVEGWICGTEGEIYLHPRWHETQKLTLTHATGHTQHFEHTFDGWGLHFEAAHVMDCLSQGLTQSPLMPLGFSVDLMKTLDAIREIIGLAY